MVDKWSHDYPTLPGPYLIRDRIFGMRPTKVTVYIYGPMFFVYPSDEAKDHSVPLGSTPSWWEWRKDERDSSRPQVLASTILS